MVAFHDSNDPRVSHPASKPLHDMPASICQDACYDEYPAPANAPNDASDRAVPPPDDASPDGALSLDVALARLMEDWYAARGPVVPERAVLLASLEPLVLAPGAQDLSAPADAHPSVSLARHSRRSG